MANISQNSSQPIVITNPTTQAGNDISWFSQQQKSRKKHNYPWLYKGGMFMLFIFMLFLIWPIVVNYQQILGIITDSNIQLLALAAVIFCTTFVFTGLAMSLLATRPMPFRQTSLIQLAMAFTYKILPAGLGGPGLMYRYAVVSGYNAQAGLGYVGAVELVYFTAWLLYFVPVVYFGGGLSSVGIATNFAPNWKIFFIVVIALWVMYLVLRALDLTTRIEEKIKEIIVSFKLILQKPKKSFLALGLMLMSYSATVLVFYFSIVAVGIEIPIWQSVFIFLIFNAVGSCGPAPGGIGTVEAALIGGLMLAGVDSTSATAGVMIFRTITFWLPTLPGYLAFRYGIKHKFI